MGLRVPRSIRVDENNFIIWPNKANFYHMSKFRAQSFRTADYYFLCTGSRVDTDDMKDTRL